MVRRTHDRPGCVWHLWRWPARHVSSLISGPEFLIQRLNDDQMACLRLRVTQLVSTGLNLGSKIFAWQNTATIWIWFFRPETRDCRVAGQSPLAFVAGSSLGIL